MLQKLVQSSTPDRREPDGRPFHQRHASWLGPAIVVGMLSAHVLLCVAMIVLASTNPSFAVEPDYYRKALAWDNTARQQRRNAELGWTAGLELGEAPSAIGERELRFRLQTADGRALDGAAVELEAFPHSRGNERHSVRMTSAGDGVYVAGLRFEPRGLWEFRFSVQRGPETFTHVVKRDVYPPGETRPWLP